MRARPSTSPLGPPRHRRPWIAVLFAWLWVWASLGVAVAGPPSSDPGEPSSPASSRPEPSSDDASDEALIAGIVAKAERIEALVAGELDPAIDAAELLTLDLREPECGQLQTLLEAIDEGRAARAAAERAAAEAATRPRKSTQPIAPPKPPPLPGPDADPLTRAQTQLLRAHWRFWTLPASERERLLAGHQARREAIAAQLGAEAAAKVRIARLQQEAKQLAALIDGELEVSIDPAPLLQIELGRPDELTSDQRLTRALSGEVTATLASAPAESADDAQLAQGLGGLAPELAAELERAAAELDAQRLRFASLTAEQRKAALERHAARQREAEDEAATAELIEADEEIITQVEEELSSAVGKAEQAKREREQAQAAAARARSEALRRIAEERARLLGVKEAHANYEVELATRKKQALAAHEVALEWDRKVAELARTRPGREREQAADAIYPDIRAALADARERLRTSLDSIAGSESGVAAVGEPLAGLPGELERDELAALRAELEASEQLLLAQEREIVWAAADGGRDDIVMLNRARLILLDLASAELRDRMTGFGSDGVIQAKREIEQIMLELRYRALALPRIGRTLLKDFETSPLPAVFGLLKLGFAFLLFRYWRRRAPELLERLRKDFLTRESGDPRVNGVIALGLWYVERIRKPLEWLALFTVLFRVLLAGGSVLEIEVLWLVVLWLNLGAAVILFVDAVAAHENMLYGHGSTLSAQLRIRSLRLVGLTVVLTGLVLSLTEEVVGRGAIHKWVRSLVWLAAIPIVLVLIRWWRDYVFRIIQGDKEIPDNALVRWIRANTEGWASFPAATIAGAYLFGRGLARWSLRRATSLETTRRLLAWMFRREVARQANARAGAEVEALPIAPEHYAEFEPAKVVEDVAALSEPMQAIAADLLAEIVALKTSQRGTLSALIGERGAGKSTFLRRLAAMLEEQGEAQAEGQGQPEPSEEPPSADQHPEFGRLTVRVIQCPPGGFSMLARAIAESIGLSRNASREQITEELSRQTPLVFLIDDAHRLVRPAIGGLAGLDKFAEFAREVSGDASWIASIGAASWQYVSRARGDHVFFDQVLTLRAWNEQQIGQLIRDRCAAAEIDPNFSDIVIPRQFDVATVAEGESRPSEAQRAELGYFRILWDYAKGNPAVALHFWRESLWIAADDEQREVKVRLFQEPRTAALEEVGATMHFVLRAVVQLEVASPADLVACTQLPPADVADALRFALARGWIDRVGSYGDRYRVTWRWYRAITDTLRRQHLLAM
ncbi:MAG: AAA family ATPase [Enhygromyxa sp.]